MNKVILPKEVASIIEMLRRVNESNAGIVRIANGDRGMVSDSLRKFADSEGGMNVLLEALVIGYEVEKAPQEELREYYRNIAEMEDGPDDGIGKGILTGVEMTLNILDINIEGIND
jgi:hypothetical protein